MSDNPNDDLQTLRKRVADNPSDLPLRFELGTALFKCQEYTSAIPELQRAMSYPLVRRSVGELLAKVFDMKGMTDLAAAIRQRASGAGPDEGGSAPVPAVPPPSRPPVASTTKEIPRDDENA